MSAIGPGDWVEALRSHPAEDGCISVTAGSLYRVARLVCISPPIEGCNDCGDDTGDVILLEGDKPLYDEYGWCRCNFKPIGGKRAELINFLLAPAPAAPAELAPA